MRRTTVFVFTLLFGLFNTGVQADNPAASKPAATAQSTPQRGTLYRVTYRGNTSYLFGTVHVGKTAFYPLEPEVTRAFSASKKLVIEVDIRNTDAMRLAIMRHGIYPAGQTINQHLSADASAQLRQALRRYGTSFESISRMKPWMVANLLLVQEMARQGFPTEQGIELHFLSLAEKQKKTVLELETADYQLSLFDSMSDAEQEEYLVENLTELASGVAMQKALDLIKAWQTADAKALDAALLEMQKGENASDRFLQKVLLDRRNPAMAQQVEALLKTDKTSFVAVGALHLLGAKGVPGLLQQRGYTVQKLY
ncbi:conjugal transfer protein TraB [Herminiimonas sp. KBW02]|uniref:TraB/GumN family protein n=1 Tax=Herminiimonas sp. KBW02 TaxID=2153363 RepID=UPI000F58F785|nr:TraB/GumN family protein [Herminiimonas sp. KBW02]RQO34739.1 conjugal transfer protein TraB [Herminiimonas sp. KBW02]